MNLTPKMKRALAIARRDGAVAAGKGEHAGQVERVSANTIRALITRGLLEHCYTSEGGYAGKIPPPTYVAAWRVPPVADPLGELALKVGNAITVRTPSGTYRVERVVDPLDHDFDPGEGSSWNIALRRDLEKNR